MTKLGIDIGNYSIKTSTGIIFESKLSFVNEFKCKCDTIKYNNKEYYVGIGNFETEYRKFDKHNYIPLLLSAICKSTDEEDIDLCIGLPIIQYKNKVIKQELLNMLQSNTFLIEWNGDYRIIRLNTVQILPEGITGYLYMLSTDDTLYYKVASRDSVIIDVGGGTIDIALIQNNKATQPTSINKGTINIYDIIKKELSEKYWDTKITSEKIPYYLEHGFYYKGEKQDIQFAINKTFKIFKEVYDELKMNYPITTEAVIIMGGGATLIGQSFEKNIKGIIIRDDLNLDIFANANGYKMFMK